MDVNTLLAMTPEEVAQAIIARRHELSDTLPNIVRDRKQELDQLNPLVETALKERDKATDEVSNLKGKRDSLQSEAKELRKKLTSLRETLIEEKKLKNSQKVTDRMNLRFPDVADACLTFLKNLKKRCSMHFLVSWV